MVSLEQLEDTEGVTESELLPVDPVKRDTHLPLYVTASVDYNDFHSNFTIGDGSSSTDPMSQRIFYNIPLEKQQVYYYFIRAYSQAHTTEVRVVVTKGVGDSATSEARALPLFVSSKSKSVFR